MGKPFISAAIDARGTGATFSAILMLLLLGSCGIPKDFNTTQDDLAAGSHAVSTPESLGHLVIGAYNIQFGLEPEQAVADIRGDSTLSGAHFLLLQEMDSIGTEFIAQELGYNFVYYPASIHPKYGRPFGNAILSRWPLLDPYFVLLPKDGFLSGTPRIVVVADTWIDGIPLRLATVHTSTTIIPQDQRLDQAQTVAENIADFDGAIVVGGDFNTAVRNDVALIRAIFREQGFRQARLPEGSTVQGGRSRLFPGDLILDHIFYRGLELEGTGIAKEAEASDHLPIWASFAWPPRSE